LIPNTFRPKFNKKEKEKNVMLGVNLLL